MVLTSQLIPVPGVRVVAARTNAGFLCRTGRVQRAASARNGEGTGPGKWECITAPCRHRAAAAGQEILHRFSSHWSSWSWMVAAHPVGHGTKGWSTSIPDGRCWHSLWGELNCSLISQLLCAAKTVSVTVKGEEGHSEGRLKRSEAQIDLFKGWAEWQMPVR